MESWIATAPLTDNFNSPGSCVFKRCLVGDTVTYFCRLCSRNDAPTDQLDWGSSSSEAKRKAHLADPIHKQRAALLVQNRVTMVGRFSWTRRLDGDLKYYRSSRLEAAVCRHIFSGSFISQAAVERQLKELRVAEPMVQLELALWKAACEQSPPDGELSPRQWKDWAKSGWKQLKPTMRSNPLIGIAALVAPFVGLTKETKKRKCAMSGLVLHAHRKSPSDLGSAAIVALAESTVDSTSV
jgi:hypothetical protein